MDGVKKNIEVKKVLYKNEKDFHATIVNSGNGTMSIAIHNAVPGIIQMKVFDITGRVVLSESLDSSTTNIIKSIYLNKGVYVLKLVNDRGETFTSKLLAD